MDDWEHSEITLSQCTVQVWETAFQGLKKEELDNTHLLQSEISIYLTYICLIRSQMPLYSYDDRGLEHFDSHGEDFHRDLMRRQRLLHVASHLAVTTSELTLVTTLLSHKLVCSWTDPLTSVQRMRKTRRVWAQSVSFSKPLPLHSLSVLLRLIFLLQCLLDRSLVALESNIAEASRRNRKNEYRIQTMAITDPSPTRSLKTPRRSPDSRALHVIRRTSVFETRDRRPRLYGCGGKTAVASPIDF